LKDFSLSAMLIEKYPPQYRRISV